MVGSVSSQGPSDPHNLSGHASSGSFPPGWQPFVTQMNALAKEDPALNAAWEELQAQSPSPPSYTDVVNTLCSVYAKPLSDLIEKCQNLKPGTKSFDQAIAQLASLQQQLYNVQDAIMTGLPNGKGNYSDETMFRALHSVMNPLLSEFNTFFDSVSKSITPSEKQTLETYMQTQTSQLQRINDL